MKKILIILIVLFCGLKSMAQFPYLAPPLGSPLSVVPARGGIAIDSTYYLTKNYTDTSVANVGFIKNIPGATIRVNGGLYVRNQAATSWNKLLFIGDIPTAAIPTFQEVLDAESANAQLNKNDTITLNGNKLVIRSLSGLDGLFRVDMVNGSGNSVLYSDYGSIVGQVYNSSNTAKGYIGIGLGGVLINGEIENSGNFSQISVGYDSISIRPDGGDLNIDSLDTGEENNKVLVWNSTTGKVGNRTAVDVIKEVFDTLAIAAFGGGSGNSADTSAFSTDRIYGSFFHTGSDSLIVTNLRIGLQGSSASVTVKVFWNDSLNVEAGATALVTAGSAASNITTGTSVTSFDNTKIPPGVWVWCKTSALSVKPTYLTVSLVGYKKRVY